MLFGIDSMDYLKTHAISYNVKPSDYEDYFKKMGSNWNNTYVNDSNDHGKDSFTWESAVAILFMASPLLTLAGILVFRQ